MLSHRFFSICFSWSFHTEACTWICCPEEIRRLLLKIRYTALWNQHRSAGSGSQRYLHQELSGMPLSRWIMQTGKIFSALMILCLKETAPGRRNYRVNEAVSPDKRTVGYKRRKLSMTKGTEAVLNLPYWYLQEEQKTQGTFQIPLTGGCGSHQRRGSDPCQGGICPQPE